jgi:hypothetical protein
MTHSPAQQWKYRLIKLTLIAVMLFILSLVMMSCGGFGPCGPVTLTAGLGLWLALLSVLTIALSIFSAAFIGLLQMMGYFPEDPYRGHC